MARPGTTIVVAGCALALAAAAMTSACATPVPTARSGADYERKAAHTADEVRSAVQTTLVALRAAEDDRLLERTLGVLVTEAEDDAGGAAETFLAVQPKGDHSDATRRELADLLDEATDELAGIRIAVRRGEAGARREQITELRRLADDLKSFTEQHDA